MQYLILENLTEYEKLVISYILRNGNMVEANVENRQRILDDLVYDFEDAEVYIKKETE